MKGSACRATRFTLFIGLNVLFFASFFVIAETTVISNQQPEYPLNVIDALDCAQQDPNQPPLMRVIPPGSFLMGSPEDEKDRFPDEGPQRQVVIEQAFAISVCEITKGQFAAFVQETGYRTDAETSDGCFGLNSEKNEIERRQEYHWQNLGYEQTDYHPAVCISHNDANAYIAWLNLRTGLDFRLPSEAEWEYAARGRTSTRFSFGNDLNTEEQCRFANGGDETAKSQPWWIESFSTVNCNDGAIYTARVGSYLPNPFGLYDMHGNVLEWTQDCWHETYDNAPLTSRPWMLHNNGNCDYRVLRGGSWFDEPGSSRSAFRDRINPVETFLSVGFRIARDI